MDIIDLIISYTGFNKTKTYKDFITLSSISQLIRYKTHSKKNIGSIIIIFKKYSALLTRILFKNTLIKLSIFNFYSIKEKYDLAIIYPNNDQWVLRGISNDLAVQFNKNGLKVLEIPANKIKEAYKAKHILFIQHDLAIRLTKFNSFLLKNSSVYITHLRTISFIKVEELSKFQYVFCQSSKDQMRLYTLGSLPGRVIHLPIGIDQNKFYNFNDFNNREYDFVISTPLKLDSLGSHYWFRKSSILLQDIILELINRNYKILVIGEGWNKSFIEGNSNIKIINPGYSTKNKFLNNCKVFLNLSLLEGGPVTILEALAAGCSIISKDNGLSIDLSIDFPKNLFIIKNIFNKYILTNEIEKIYKNLSINDSNFNRELLVKKYSFKSLANQIIKNIDF
tara:strand:+ start:2540 stop:3721 length:1182 start_codon:yes stop_codon:yes gene_type:complete